MSIPDAPSQNPTYDLVLLGASGYTGRFAADYITESLPLDLRWAVAGRNRAKLTTVVDALKILNPARPTPGIEIVDLNSDEQLNELAQKTRLVISTVGPYQNYGTSTFRACAQNGTHYVDCTAEIFWVSDMIKEYDEVAKKNGAIMIPCTGITSIPSDISTWVAVDYIRRNFSASTSYVDTCVHSIRAGISGGTMTSFKDSFDHYNPFQLLRIHAPYAISPRVPSPKPTAAPKNVQTRFKYLGFLKSKELGWLGYQPQALIDRALVHRSWGLLASGSNPETHYGDNFKFHGWTRLGGAISAVFWHIGLVLSAALFLLRPVRWLLVKLWYEPGEGQSRKDIESNWMEYRTVAASDLPKSSQQDPRKVLVRMRYNSDMYLFTAVTLGEAARLILQGHGTQAHKIRGGVLTTATLGQPFVERLRQGGVIIDVKEKGEEENMWGGK